MKKTFKTFALMLLTAFAFSSCVDVPAPYNLPDKSSNSGSGGSGVIEGTPVTCAQAAELASALAEGATSSELYTITGYITQVVGEPSRNQQTFWMADTKDGGKVFEAYYANLPEGVTAFAVGTKVKITGKLLKFIDKSNNVIPEMKNATVQILTDDGGDTPPVEGTEINCAEAVQLTNALADGGTSADTYAVTGYITETDGKVSRNQQVFWMADDMQGGKVFQAYWANLPSGVSVFTVGMKVTITGKLLKFIDKNNGNAVICEIKNADVVIHEQGDDGGQGGDGGDTPGPGGDDVTELVNGNFEEWVSDTEPLGWKSASTASNAKLSQSQDAHGGTYSCRITAASTVNPNSPANQRLATQEITLEAGTYTFSFYAKATTGDVCQTRPGYVPINADGSVGTYTYKDLQGNQIYVDINNNEWTLASIDFTLTQTTKLCLIVMNPKTTQGKSISQDILVDDATLVKK